MTDREPPQDDAGHSEHFRMRTIDGDYDLPEHGPGYADALLENTGTPPDDDEPKPREKDTE